MEKVKKRSVKPLVGLLIVIVIFILMSYLIQKNLGFIERYFDFGVFGVFIFIFLVAASIVFSPFSAIPLFPIATSLWGWVWAGFFGFVGWTIGAVIAFVLARVYGADLVSKFIPIESFYKFEKRIPREHLFLTLVFFRIVTPIDGISYFFGLFTTMSFGSYLLATIIGLIPFSFAIAYLGSVPLFYQLLFLSLAFAVFILSLFIAYHKKSGK